VVEYFLIFLNVVQLFDIDGGTVRLAEKILFWFGTTGGG